MFWREVLLLLIIVVTLTRCVVVINVNDASWFWTEHNWYLQGSTYSQTANPGAYFKTTFSGSMAVLHLDQSSVPTTTYATVGWTIDTTPEQTATLPVKGNKLILASQLENNTRFHTIYFYLKNSLQSQDRWNTVSAHIRITGLELNDGETIAKPTLQPMRTLVYWDSIGEGVNVNPGNGDLIANDAHITWAFSLKEALQSELSVVAWGRQGYAVTGNGNVPPLWTPNPSSNTSAWAWFDSLHPRPFPPCPDYILCGHGTNDWLLEVPEITVTEHALGWVTNQRRVCPSSWIFLVVPFGGFNEGPLLVSYKEYQGMVDDEKVVYVSLGEEAKVGLDKWGKSYVSVDGIHPWAWRDGQLGALLGGVVLPYL